MSCMWLETVLRSGEHQKITATMLLAKKVMM